MGASQGREWALTAPSAVAYLVEKDDEGRVKLDHLGLLPLLDACCISGELGVRKPDPRICEMAATRCGQNLAEAWMVGDGEVDILGARRAGIRSIWLRRGRTWPRSDVKPNHAADSILEALALLEASQPRSSNREPSL